MTVALKAPDRRGNFRRITERLYRSPGKIRLAFVVNYRGHPKNKRWGVEAFANGGTLRFAGHALHIWRCT